MNIKKLSFKTKTLLVMGCAVMLLCSGLAYAGDNCQIIKITKDKAGGGSSILVSPEKATVPVGTCTVWVNFVRKTEMRVSFRENAKECMLSTEPQTGFSELKLKTGESCYYSEKMPHGKTASLVWTNPGTYKYTLETLATTGTHYAGDIRGEGVIEVTGGPATK